jgi:hypothetical protein
MPDPIATVIHHPERAKPYVVRIESSGSDPIEVGYATEADANKKLPQLVARWQSMGRRRRDEVAQGMESRR